MAESAAAAAAVNALAGAARGRLVLVSPDGVRGNPADPEPFDAAREVDGGIELSFGRGHAVLQLTGVRVVEQDRSSLVLQADRVCSVVTPYVRGTAVRRTWSPGSVAVTWDPDRARALGRTDGVLEPAAG